MTFDRFCFVRWFYAQPNSLAMLAVKKVTTNAVPNVITTLRVAHLSDLVSLYIVMIVVAHGLCKSANNIRFTAVSIVQPLPLTSRSKIAALDDGPSIIMPAPM